jgi:hypothetical protein
MGANSSAADSLVQQSGDLSREGEVMDRPMPRKESSDAWSTPQTDDLAVDRARHLVRQAVAELQEPFSRVDVFGWFDEHAPDVPRLVVDGLLIAGTVNDPHRQHFPDPEDLLFAGEGGRYWKYDPHLHGRWSVGGRLRPGHLYCLQMTAVGPAALGV